MLIQIDTSKLYQTLHNLRQNVVILSTQINRLNRLEDKIFEAWYSPDSTYDYVSEVQQLREKLEKLRALTEDEIGVCARIINKARLIEESSAGGGSGGGRF